MPAVTRPLALTLSVLLLAHACAPVLAGHVALASLAGYYVGDLTYDFTYSETDSGRCCGGLLQVAFGDGLVACIPSYGASAASGFFEAPLRDGPCGSAADVGVVVYAVGHPGPSETVIGFQHTYAGPGAYEVRWVVCCGGWGLYPSTNADGRLLAVVPQATDPIGPNPNCTPRQAVHGYHLTSSVEPTPPIGVHLAAVRDGNTVDCNGDTIRPDFDGDAEYGAGGALLPASHHGATVTVRDFVHGTTDFMIGSDGDGDGLVDRSAPDCLQGPFSGTATTTCPPGSEDHWWVFLLMHVHPDGTQHSGTGGTITAPL